MDEPGAFAQDDIDLSRWLAVSVSGRIDAHNRFGTFVSPRGSVLVHGADWNKAKLWDYLLLHGLLRVMVVVAGAGPHASGMPELQLALNATSHPLHKIGVLVTDGRVSFHHDGISIAHVVPEALDGGGLAAVRTGDWIYLNLTEGEFNVVAQSAQPV
jgi:hypothetical protein